MFAVSAAGRTGLNELLAAWWKELQRLDQILAAEAAKAEVALP
jgi:hypothetical protein